MKAAVERLDRSRPFGEVCGETEHNIAYCQKAKGIESWPYDSSGVLIEAALNAPQRSMLDKLRKATPPKVEEPVKADEAFDTDEGERPQAEPDDGVNFVMWLKGEARYRPHELQNAGKARYAVNKANVRELARFLVEEKKLLPRSEVHPSILPPSIPNPA